MIFSQFLEALDKSPYVYHVTYLTNVDNIFKSRLMPSAGFSPWLKPHIKNYSKGKLFFCSTLQCAKSWADTLMDQSFHLSDNPIEQNLIPIILRFRLNRNSKVNDLLGNAEAKSSYYTKRTINPLGLQVWSGTEWTTDESAAENIKFYFDENDLYTFSIGNYPFPTK